MAPEAAPLASEGPLSRAELADLEATLLPALERHNLRLLAHGLRTLQAIAAGQHAGLPDRESIRRWAAQQHPIAGDAAFIEALSGQLAAAGQQLQQIATAQGVPPLELSLQDLATWASRQADHRLGPGHQHHPQQGQ